MLKLFNKNKFRYHLFKVLLICFEKCKFPEVIGRGPSVSTQKVLHDGFQGSVKQKFQTLQELLAHQKKSVSLLTCFAKKKILNEKLGK